MQCMRVQALAGELRFHMPCMCGQKERKKEREREMMVCDYCFFPFLKISFCLLHIPFPGFLQPFPLSRHNFCDRAYPKLE